MSFESMRGVLIGGGGYRARGAQHWVLAVIDLDAPSPSAIPLSMGFLPHGFAFDPTAPSRVAVFEKKGPGACVLDARTGALERALAPGPARAFYGHGAFSSDGALLYATESLLDEGGRGLLVVRDARTFEELGALPTHGFSPHDCLLVDGGRTMVVANGGGPIGVRGSSLPCVTYIDTSSGRLREKVLLPSPTINAGHVAVSSRGDLVVVSAPRDGVGPEDRSLGGVTLRPARKKAVPASAPAALRERMVGESLSIALDGDERVALTTQPFGDCVYAWSVLDGRLLGVLELEAPRGVALTLDQRCFAISHRRGNAMVLSLFDARTLQPLGAEIEPSFLTGSHIVIRALSPRATP